MVHPISATAMCLQPTDLKNEDVLPRPLRYSLSPDLQGSQLCMDIEYCCFHATLEYLVSAIWPKILQAYAAYYIEFFAFHVSVS